MALSAELKFSKTYTVSWYRSGAIPHPRSGLNGLGLAVDLQDCFRTRELHALAAAADEGFQRIASTKLGPSLRAITSSKQ
jgi:hypothetical protein